jgi:hypothetical protein
MLSRMDATSGQTCALLTLPSSLVPVRVFRRQLVSPVTMCLACVLSCERSASRYVFPVRDGLPMSRILTSAMFTCITTRAVWIMIVACVVNCLPWFQWPHQLSESISMSTRLPISASEFAIVFLVTATCPRPAVIRTTLINVGAVVVDTGKSFRDLPAYKRISVLHQLLVVSVTQPFGAHGTLTMPTVRHRTIVAHDPRVRGWALRYV